MNPKRRKSNRFKGYDYSQAGCYFVTVCAQDRQCLFGEIIEDQMVLNEVGKMVTHWWGEAEKKFPQVELDEYVLMPNQTNIKGYEINNVQKINNTKNRADTQVRPYRKSYNGSKP